MHHRSLRRSPSRRAARAALALAGLVGLAALAGCGGAAAELPRGPAPHYHAPVERLYAAAVAATRAKGYSIGDGDRDHGAFVTVERFWGPAGEVIRHGRSYWRINQQIGISYDVRLVAVGGDDTYDLVIVPHLRRVYYADHPLPEPLTLQDADLPEWAPVKLDELTQELRAALAPFAANGGT